MIKGNKLWKLFLSGTLTLSIGLFSLTGCGTKVGTEDPGSANETSSTAAVENSSDATALSEANSDKVQLTFGIWDEGQKDGMQSMVDQFEKENPNIQVTIEVTPWDQYFTKLQAAGSASTAAWDIFWMHPDQVYTLADGNQLMDLTDETTSGKIDLTKFPSNINGNYNINGKQYAIPKDDSTFALWYNKDLFDAAGVSYPDETH